MANDPNAQNKRLLSDGTVVHENPNEFVQFTHRDEVLEEHITVPKDNPQAAHWSAYQDGEKLGQEPLNR